VVIFMTITGACVGAYASVKHVRLPQAMSLGIGVLVLIQIWPLIALLIETMVTWAQVSLAGGGARPMGMPRTLVLMAFAPLAGLVMQSETLSGVGGWGGKLGVVMLGAGVNTLVSAACIALATRGLAGLIRRGELSATVAARPGLVSRVLGGIVGERRGAKPAATGADAGSAVPTAFNERKSREVGENPVMWREVKLLEKQRMKRWIVGLLLPLLFAGMLVVAVSSPGMFDFETVAIMVTVLGTLVFILRTVTSMSDAVSSERQTGTWIALITTPMEPERIIHGKLIGPMLRHWPMLVVVMTPAVVAVVLGRGALLLPVMIFLIVTMWGIAAQVTGLFLSLAVRKAGAATTLNLGLYLGLWLGLPVALAMIGGIARINVSRDLSEWVLVLNPVFMVGQTMEAGISRGQNWESSVQSFRVFGESTSSGVFTLVLMALWLVVVGAAWGVVRLMIARFATLSLRGL
jgi:ABC-type transport system involved in multi-copper enzyme maturation permease subunit